MIERDYPENSVDWERERERESWREGKKVEEERKYCMKGREMRGEGAGVYV